MAVKSSEVYPAALHTAVTEKLAKFNQHQITIDDPQVYNTLPRVFAVSEFVADSCVQFPKLFSGLLADNSLTTKLSINSYKNKLASLLTIKDQQEYACQLRLLRKQQMLRIAWRDIAGWASVDETLADVSQLADQCILHTVEYIYQKLVVQHGVPRDYQGIEQQLYVIAMGKLGGNELNFSSDVDLIFAYPKDGSTESDERQILANQQFFIKLVQQFTKVFSEVTPEGFVFRVDLRLRPHGSSGEIVTHFAALETYYQEQGRDWERYAMVKARVLNPSDRYTLQINNILTSFVYRRYVDFSVVESMRSLKSLIQREVKVQGLQQNIKRGAGGIREIEFVCQVLQVMRGGQDRYLQQTNLLKVLPVLRENGFLDEDAEIELATAYRSLRRLENYLQMHNDQQIHTLPESDLMQCQIAYAMGYDNWNQFYRALNQLRNCVSRHFSITFNSEDSDYADSERILDNQILSLWHDQLASGVAQDILATLGFTNTEQGYLVLQAFRQSRKCQAISQIARLRLEKFIPLLLRYLGKIDNSQATLIRMITLLDAIIMRSAYLALLTENIQALQHLIKLFSLSAWIADQVATQPFLLEVLLDQKTLYHPLAEQALHIKIGHALVAVPNADSEQQMEELRRFKLRQLLRVAAAEVTGSLEVWQVSNHLSATASVVLKQVLDLAATELSSKYPEVAQVRQNFAIIAYGKFGGYELNYASDLDIVFLHNNPPDLVYYTTRLTQRIIHLLNTRTAAGVLYSVDTRLRPSGSAGLLVSHIDAYCKYQQQSAWTWEHQALVRARVICADQKLTAQFNQLRYKILSQPRDLVQLKQDIIKMRQRMRATKSIITTEHFDLKQGAGGIIDIEFLVQYAVLAWGSEHKNLLDFTDNVGIINTLARVGVIDLAKAQRFSNTYLKLRRIQHSLMLQDATASFDMAELKDERELISSIWQQWLCK